MLSVWSSDIRNGNLTAYNDRVLDYTAENRLDYVSMPGLEAEFAYDALGRRKTMRRGSTETVFIHDGDMDLAKAARSE